MSKRAGTAWERAVVEVFKRRGFPADRHPPRGRLDVGDVSGVSVGGRDVTVECKAAARLELSAWMDELERECSNAGSEVGVLVVKRRNKGADDAFAVMPLGKLADLLASWPVGAGLSPEAVDAVKVLAREVLNVERR